MVFRATSEPGDNCYSRGRFNADEWYSVLEKSGVTVWYSAPTAFRMLMAEGDEKLATMIYLKFAIF